MPILRKLELKSISDDEFSRIDSVVMNCAYAVQNHFGRRFDEQVYENDLAARLRAAGLLVYTQVPVTVKHCGFEKTFYLDLVVNHMLYELKVADYLTAEYDAQALNYAMLQEIPLVKLINFGEAKVRGKLLRNALSTEDRYRPSIDKAGWKPLGASCGTLFDLIKNLILDWGTHLDCRVYNEAIVQHFGGEQGCLRRAVLVSGGACLGSHRVQQHDKKHGFIVTGFTKQQDGFHTHLKVLLRHAPSLSGIQWINLNHSRLELNTILPD